MWAYYILSLWQMMCGLALIFEQSKVYALSKIPQARRVAELCGISWILLGVLLYFASFDETKDTFLGKLVAWSNIIFGGFFSLLAGPLRLTPANPREKILVPLNTALVIWLIFVLLY